MGDVRYERHYREVAEAPDRMDAIRALSNEEIVMALAAASRKNDPLLANVLATEAMNRMRRAGVIAEHLGEGVLAVDEHNRVTFANPAALEILGYERGELIGSVLHDIVHVHEDGSPMPPEACAVTITLRTGRIEQRRDHGDGFRRADGAIFPVAFTSAPVTREGEVEGAVVVFGDLTKEREAEAARERLVAIVDSSEDAIVAETDEGVVTHWNAGAERLFGYRSEEIVGKSIALLMPPEIRDAQMGITRRVGRGGTSYRSETVRMCKDGSRVHVSVVLSPLPGAAGRRRGLSAIYRDITPQKEAEEALRKSEERFRKVFENAHDGMLLMDPERDRIVDANPRAAEIVGRSREDIRENVRPSDLHREEMAEFQALLEGVQAQGRGWSKTLTYRHRLGHRVPVEVSASLVELDGRRLVLAMVRDITELKRAEAEVARLLAQERALHASVRYRLATLLPALAWGLGSAVALRTGLLAWFAFSPSNWGDELILATSTLGLAAGALVGGAVYLWKRREWRART